MGKSKHRRPAKSNVYDPTGLMNVSGSAEVEANHRVEAENDEHGVRDRGYGTIVSLVKQLQSPGEEQRECACLTLVGLLTTPEAVGLMLRAGVVRVVAPLLLDPYPAVRLAAVGTLRNMSVEATPEMCEKMVASDVMTALVALLRECVTVKSDGAMPKKRDPATLKTDPETLKSQILFHAVHLVLNLCENSEVAVSVFNREKLADLMLPWLQPLDGDCTLSIAVARCIHAVTDDNSTVACQLMSSLGTLTTLMKKQPHSSAEILLHTLAAGIVYNVVSANAGDADVICHVVEVLAKVLQEDVLSVVQQVAALLSADVDTNENGRNMSAEGENGTADITKRTVSAGDDKASPQKKELEKKLNDHENLSASQQLAAEIITNMCCPLDGDDDNWEDCGNSDTSNDDVIMDTDMEISEPQDDSLQLPANIHSIMASHDIVAKMITKCKMLDDGLLRRLQTDDNGKKALKAAWQVQSRCLFCLANMVSVLDVDTLGGQAMLGQMWSSLSQLAVTQTVLSESSLLEAVTSAMRATSQRLTQLDSQKLCEVTSDDLELLYQLGRQCEHSAVRTNVVRVICTIGCTLARTPAFYPLLKGVAEFLYAVAAGDSCLPVVAEALDAIFDVFAEDCVDSVMRDVDLVSRLRALLPVLKTTFQQQKRHLGEHLVIVSTAKANLARFISYKSQRNN